MRLSTSICGCDGLHIFLDHFVSAKFVYLLFHYITYSIDSFFFAKNIVLILIAQHGVYGDKRSRC
jgi:hypothetical protein